MIKCPSLKSNPGMHGLEQIPCDGMWTDDGITGGCQEPCPFMISATNLQARILDKERAKEILELMKVDLKSIIKESLDSKIARLMKARDALQARDWIEDVQNRRANPDRYRKIELFDVHLTYRAASREGEAAKSYFEDAFVQAVPALLEHMELSIARDIKASED